MLQDITCPRCRNQLLVEDDVDLRGLTCPRCLASLAGAAVTTQPPSSLPERRRRPPGARQLSLDVEVHNDTGLMGLGLILVGVLGLAGIIAFFVVGMKDMEYNQVQLTAMIGAGAALVLIVPIVLGIIFSARSKVVAKQVIFTLLGATAILGVIGTVIVAGCIFVLAACFASCEKGHGGGSYKSPAASAPGTGPRQTPPQTGTGKGGTGAITP